MSRTHSSRQIPRTNRTTRFHKYVAFTIAFAIFFSPFQIPLSDIVLTSSPDDSIIINVVPQAESLAANIQKSDEAITTYTRGESDAILTIPTVAQIALSIPEPYTTLDLLVPDVTTETITIKKSRTGNRNLSLTELAARQVASGENVSELVRVTLDESANITNITDIHGSETNASYTTAGNPKTIATADGTIQNFTYDIEGNLTGIVRIQEDSTTPAEESSLLSYILKPIFALADFGSDETEKEAVAMAYDKGQLTDISDDASAVSFEYDEEGLLTREYRDDGSSVAYYYDELGNIVETVEEEAENDSFSYNSLLSFSFAQFALPSLQSLSSYNDSNQLASFTVGYADTTVEEPVVASSTDVAIVPVDLTTPSSSTPLATESAGSSSTTPDEIGAVVGSSTETSTSVTTPTPTPVTPDVPTDAAEAVTPSISETIIENIVSFFTTGYNGTLALLERKLSRSFADETPAATTTTDATLEEAATTTSSTPAAPLFALSFAYDNQGNLLSETTATGIVTTYRYHDSTNALVSKVVSGGSNILSTREYQTNSQARVIGINNEAYVFDEIGQLTQSGTTNYRYDTNGNRIEMSGVNASVNYQYTGNRLETAQDGNGQVISYEYNERGAVVRTVDNSGNDTTFTYTLSGAIESITRAGVTIGYTYDGLGRRTSRTATNAPTQYYAYTGSQLKRVTSENEDVLREYFYTPTGKLVSVQIAGTLYQVVTDRNQSILGLLNTVTGEYHSQSYNAWGKVTATQLPGDLDLGYIGAFFEPTLGYSIFGPRVYDPSIGRFLSKDPLPGVIIDTLSQNEYIYAKNDPINQYDPSGHASTMAETSSSPKRALVETRQSITDVSANLRTARRVLSDLNTTQTNTQTEDDSIAIRDATDTVTSLTESLAVLQTIEADQLAEIAENELPDTEEIPELIPAPVVFDVVVPTKNTPVVLEDVTSVIPAAEMPAPETPEQIVVPTVEVINSTTEPTAEPIALITAFTTGLLALASMADIEVLKAEAKSKKKNKKSKSKSKKEKQKASKKAKDKQEKRDRKTIKLLNKVLKLQTELSRVKAAESSSGSRSTVAIATPTKPLNTSATVNLVTQAQHSAQTLNTAASRPTFTYNNPTSLSSQLLASGVTSPAGGFFSGVTTSTKAHIALTACGFEPTVIGATCGIADGILYLFQGQWGDAGLSVLSSVPFIGATADGGKAARLALKVAEEGRVVKTITIGTVGIIRSEELIFSTEKIIPQMIERGWTKDSVKNLINNPYTTRIAANKQVNPPRPATVYYAKDGTYVSVDNVTKEVIQITDNVKVRSGNWFADSSIINPYTP